LVSILVSISSFSQARLTEIYPDGGGSNQYFEVFNFGTSLSNLKLLSKYKITQGQNIIDSGFYVFSFPAGTNLTPSSYWYAAQSAGSGSGGNAISYANANLNYNAVKSIKRYSQVNGVPSPSADTTVSMFSPNENFVFLVNGNNIIDYMVSGPSGNSIPTVQAQINSWSPFTFGGNTIRFTGVQLFKQYVPSNSAGSNNFFLVTISGSCQTIASSPWETGTSRTPGLRNSPQSTQDPTADFWEQSYKIPTTLDKSTYGLTFEQVSNTFPLQTYALDNFGSTLSTPSKMYYQVSLENTNITPAEFAAQTKGLMKIYSDVDGDRTISSSDLNKTANANITYNNLTASIILNLTEDMFTPVGTKKKLNPILFTIVNDVNGCFETRNIMSTNAEFLLPAALSDFKIKNELDRNLISWKTASESNNKGFEIQRAIGNANDFRTIGFVGSRAKNGYSETEITYNFEDVDLKAGQTHYYRLKQFDFDGKSTYSPVRSIKPGSIESNLNVYPNPSQGNVTVQTGSTSGKMNIYVLDNTGRVVNQFLNITSSNTRINNLKKGFYTLKIANTETGEQSAQRVVVQ
jgi:hypothetical protein